MRIRTAQGSELFSQNDVEAPKDWSDLAVSIAASRYFRRMGDSEAQRESSIRDLAHRVVTTLRKFGRAWGYFASDAEAESFEQDLKFIIYSQRAAFNSPVWFNLGLFHCYGQRGSGGNFRFDLNAQRLEQVASNYEWPQVSACFILSAKDSLDGIFDLLKTEARLFKFGSGTGTNFSPLRAKGEALASGGTTSGLLSFLEVFDKAAGATKSGGVTRRAAKMVCLDADHPEVLEFIRWKQAEEQKAQALIQAGYSSDMDGPAYRTVAGQNSNNSVRLSDDFFEVLKSGGKWSLRARTSGAVVKEIPSRQLWTALVEAAWFCADPGVQFTSTIERMNPCKVSGAIEASNPCSEYMFLNDTACNLASVNLVRFLQDDGSFDVKAFEQTCRLLLIAQDILVSIASYPTPEVAERSVRFRPLGLGYANLGGLLMRLGIGYGQDESLPVVESVTALMHAVAGCVSADLARQHGPFAEYSLNQNSFVEVVETQGLNYAQLVSTPWTRDLIQRAQTLWKEVESAAATTGFRNAQWTVLAPTGTIGLLMDCDTTGIEPEYSLQKVKVFAGGGETILVNHSVAAGLKALGYAADQIDHSLLALQQSGTLKGTIADPHLPVFDCAVPDSSGRSLSTEAHLKVMQAAQKFLSGAISKTVNLPSTASVVDVEAVYLKAYQMGLKSISMYRAGSKWSEPLSSLREVSGPKCSECGAVTITTGGCYRCLNCGHAESC